MSQFGYLSDDESGEDDSEKLSQDEIDALIKELGQGYKQL